MKQEEKKFYGFVNPAKGMTSAISAKEAIKDGTLAESEAKVECYPYCVQHFTFNPESWVQDWMDKHHAEIESALRKAAVYYYTDLNDNLVANMLNAFNDVVYHSIRIYMHICTMHKMQNRRNLVDDQGRPIHILFNYADDTSAITGTPTYDRTNEHIIGEWSITNNSWDNDFLSKLAILKITPECAAVIRLIMNNAIQLKESDDGTLRYVDLIPYAMPESLADEKDLLDTEYSTLQARLNSYTFFPALFDVLGMSYNDWGYDADGKALENFTRDLSGKRFNCMVDDHQLLFDVMYSSSNVPRAAEISEGDSMFNCVISASEFEGSRTTITGPHNVDRIIAQIETLMNALRNNIFPLNVTYLLLLLTSNSYAEAFGCINPYFLEAEAALDTTTLTSMNASNRTWALLALSNSGITKCVLSVNADHTIHNSKYSRYVGINDYLLSQSDVEAIISDAVYAVVFAGCVGRFLSSKRQGSQTTGNANLPLGDPADK